jgi:hypothetical protein
MERHCDNFKLCVGVLDDQTDMIEWLGRHAPNAVIVPIPPFSSPSAIWQVKPVLILHLFSQGIRDVTWLDADLIVLRDLEPLFATLDEKTVMLAREFDYPFEFHETVMEAFQMRPGHPLQGCINTCMIRVTVEHEPLIRKLLECIDTPFFVEQTSTPPPQRKIKWHYDQTVMEMLLCSVNENWNYTAPIRLVPAGAGFIQELGVTRYGIGDRLRNGFGLNRPWLIHCLGVKPWDPREEARKYRTLSVYSAFASSYRQEVEEPMPWARSKGWQSLIGRWLSFGQPHWMGLFHCMAGKLWQLLKSRAGRASSAGTGKASIKAVEAFIRGRSLEHER